MLSVQKVTSNREGLGYVKPNSSAPIPLMENKARLPIKENNVKYVQQKPNSPKTKKQNITLGRHMTSRRQIIKKFVPTCHYCQVKGHTRPHCRKLHSSNTSHTHLVCSHDFIKFIPICHFCGMKGHIRPNCFKLHELPNVPPNYHHVNNNEGMYDLFGYGCGRTQKPRCRVTLHRKDMNVNPNHLCKTAEKIDKVNTRAIWVRKSDLRPHADLSTNSLDDMSSSGGVDLAF
ncbi:hypothetical protein RHGRI_007737 [Rhododendron griersonianum]|uniref:CCHC-type domain-containing protein n=1 Tax=Rhododendron griersonianum TaxID=479676 RepID=A0AAV6KY65_9ERIC|nr:hypothetical protein RHGRI_007737 [Rhododendron griersonianum]